MTAHSVASATSPDLAFISQQLFTAVLWVDDSLTIRWLNAQVEQLLAVSRGRLLDHSILMLLAPTELQPQTVNESLITGKSLTTGKSLSETQLSNCPLIERFVQAQQYQQPFVTHDHVIDFPHSNSAALLIDYSVTPVFYDNNNYFIIEMWGKDRQSRISEDQRQQRQYDVARQMLRSVAHEVKNPLAGIRGAAQLLERQFNKLSAQTLSKKLHSYTDIIISETDRLTHLIDQLLGSNQPAHWQLINIHQPLEHVLTLVLNQYPKIELQRDYDLSLPELQADKDQLIQVFLNLINNACESMSEYDQQLTLLANQAKNDSLNHSLNQSLNDSPNNPHQDEEIDTSYRPKLGIQTRVAFQHTIGHQQHKQVLQITITDNGSGIDSALIGQIFFPMVTSRAAGTGLGLSIVQDIISRHHGMIEVNSMVRDKLSDEVSYNDKQTCFTLYLPFVQPIENQ